MSALPFSKACNLSDFSSPDLHALMRALFPEKIMLEGNGWPLGFEERKCWEVAMAVRAFEAAGKLDSDCEALGVGAGREATIYWLTRHVRRVFATDLYLEDGWEGDATAAFLRDPAATSPVIFEWNPRRLVMQHMDALNLQFEDQTFDAVFSSSSVEHFGDHAAVRSAVAEMYRVLKPGGLLSLSTELKVDGEGLGLPGVLMFSEDDLRELIVESCDWELMGGPADLAVDEATRASATSFAEAVADVVAGRPRYSTYPHVLLSEPPYLWTSVHLALVRPV